MKVRVDKAISVESTLVKKKCGERMIFVGESVIIFLWGKEIVAI